MGYRRARFLITSELSVYTKAGQHPIAGRTFQTLVDGEWVDRIVVLHYDGEIEVIVHTKLDAMWTKHSQIMINQIEFLRQVALQEGLVPQLPRENWRRRSHTQPSPSYSPLGLRS